MANFNVDSSGNLWLGTNVSDTFSTAQSQAATKFYVTSAGSIFAIQGTIGGIDLASTHIQSSNYSSTSGSEAGFKINSDGNAEFNNVTIRGDLVGVELKGQMVFDSSGNGSIKTSTTGTRVEILDNNGIEGEIRFETSSGTTARLVADSATEFTIEQSALSGGKIKLVTGVTSGGLQFTGNEINITTPLSSGNPVIKLNGTNANTAGTSTLSKLLGVTSSGRLAVGSAASGVVSISGTGDIAVTGSSGVLNIHHDDSDHSYSASGHDHDSDYYSSSAGSVLSSALTNHTSNSSAHGTFDNYSSWTLRGNPSGNPQTSTISSGNTASIYGGSGISVQMSGSSITLSGSGVSSIGQSGTDGFVKSVSGSTVTTSPTLGNIAIYTGSHYPESSFSNLGSSSDRWFRLYAQVSTSVSSDERLKENIVDINQGLDFINDLRPVEFTWKDITEYACEDYLDDKFNKKREFCNKCQKENDIAYSNYLLEKERYDNEVIEDEPTEPTFTACTWVETTSDINEGKKSWGMIAQEVETTLGDYEGQVLNHDTENDIYGLSYSSFVAPLIKAVQDLSTQILNLTARVEALEE
jgi:hypothetical protein